MTTGAISQTAAEEASERIIGRIESQLSDPNASFRLLVQLRAAPDRVDDVLRSYADQQAQVAQRPGNLAYLVSQPTDDPNAILLFEEWSNLGDLVAHMESDATLEHLARVGPWLEEGGSLSVLMPVSG